MKTQNKSKSNSLLLPSRSLKIGVVQMNSGEDINRNFESAIAALNKLQNENCDLICFPENSLFMRISKNFSGRNYFDLKENFWAELQKFVDENKCHLLFGSIPVRVLKQKQMNSSTVWLQPKKKLSVVYNKIHLFDVDVEGAASLRESDYYQAGKKPAVISVKGWNIGLSICYDIRFAELYSYYARKNVHLILVPAAFLVPTGQAHWHILLRARAIETQAYLVAAAQSGGHFNSAGDQRDTFGHSLIVAPWGEILADLGQNGQAVRAMELDPARIKSVRTQIPMAKHRRLNCK